MLVHEHSAPWWPPAEAAWCGCAGGGRRPPPAAVFLPVYLKLRRSNRSDVPQTFCSPCLSGYAAAGDNLLFARRLLTPFLFPAFVVLFQEAQESVSPGISGN